ncbi:MAG: hypothetical protein A2Z83_02955 [Omnitrophica bacterium GWA2_52_8]|nr:MAG: hypothetical protein A2Z83_02955 [Omnitrophica bacterium GWA2_52_8]
MILIQGTGNRHRKNAGLLRRQKMGAGLLLAGLMLFPGTGRLCAEAPAYRILEEIPVQDSGRVKPFQAFAQEAVAQVTGGRNFQGRPAVLTVWLWISDPDGWISQPIIPVDFRPLRKSFNLMIKDGKLSPEIILNHEPFIKTVQEAGQKQRMKAKLTPLEDESLKLYERAAIFRALAQGSHPGWIPDPEDPRKSWLSLEMMASPEGAQVLKLQYPEKTVADFQSALTALANELHTQKAVTPKNAAAFAQAVRALPAAKGIVLDEGLIRKELIYNRLHPFGWAWKIMALSILFALVRYWNLRKKSGSKLMEKTAGTAALASFAAAFLIQSGGFYLRCQIAGRPPVTNMYESVVWVSWAVAFFSLLLFIFYRSAVILFAAACVAALGLMVADSFPVVLNAAISPLVPVLRSNYWLTIHVLTITLSYGAFALAWGIGHGVVFSFAFNPGKKDRNKQFAQYLYRAVQIGVLLLSVGTVLGGVWAHYSWGRFWGWDPKETWALIALLGYLAVLHGRLSGWLETFGLAYWAVVSFLLVIMAWYGVNFVLAAGLHSYGFGGGGAPYVLGAALLDLAVITWAAQIYRAKINS